MNILCWNARGLGSSKKHRILHDLILDNKIDLVAIQETKKQSFSSRMLKGISTKFDSWHELPAVGLSGGILVGFDSSKLIIDRVDILSYSLTIFFAQ
jgi:exonuclease III